MLDLPDMVDPLSPPGYIHAGADLALVLGAGGLRGLAHAGVLLGVVGCWRCCTPLLYRDRVHGEEARFSFGCFTDGPAIDSRAHTFTCGRRRRTHHP